MTDEVRLRHPSEADHERIAAVLDHWFGGRRVWPIVGRAWFRHFAGTSWLAEDVDGTPRGFLIGYRSADRPDIAVVHLVAVDPRLRRRGIARAMVDAFAGDAGAGGASRLEAVAWPDEPVAIAFFRGLGFVPEDGPGTQRLFGVPAFPDYEVGGEDRVLLVRALPAP